MRYLLTSIFCLFLSLSYAQSEFITTWKTDNPGVSEDNQITIPSYSGNYGEITISWGDGTIDTYSNSYNLIHTYVNPGTYSVEITGNFPGFYFKDWGDNQKIISVDQWGDIEWVAAQEAFSGCENLDVLANDSPNLSKVTSTNQMFSGCYSLVGTPAFNNWDVSTITNMDSMFNSCSSFNSPIGNWDVSNVENMPAMFFNATLFNKDIRNWDVSNVKIMWAMFAGSHSFNQNIDNWDVSNVTSMGWMFTNARAFNQPLGSWDVSKAIGMDLMFDNALAFNQNISSWDVSNVTNMGYMFKNAKSFNQPVVDWDVSSVSNMGSMFRNAETFNQPLNTWDMSNVTNTSNMFYYAFGFRQDISSWDVSNVTDMSGMFNGATAFNRPINSWDVSAVTDMTRMFQYAYSFNQDLSNWNVSNVTLMDNMFHRADGFKQDISSWNIANVTSMEDMFLEIRMSKIIYDNILTSWSSLPQIQERVVFNAGYSEYCDGRLGKETLIYNNGWTITDGGEVCFSPNQFVTKWKTDNLGTSENNQITIPTFPGETYDYTVDWGDGNVDSNITGNITHTYNTTGTYYVSITGIFPRIYFNESGDKDKILTIKQWGTNQWTSMESGFAYCSNLSVAATDPPNLSNVTSLKKMFYRCDYASENSKTREYTSFNGIENFNYWDVSTITDMSHMFDKSAFGQDISFWDVSNVTDMSYLFYNTKFFNHAIRNWNVSNVVNMESMFSSSYFNRDINGWDVRKITNMSHMFNDAIDFNQNLENWKIEKVENMEAIFNGSGLSTTNYDKTLNAWSDLPLLLNNVKLEAVNINYCNSVEGRQFLIDNYGWEIMDAGNDCTSTYFITTWKTDNPGASGDNQITIPTFPEEIYNYTVDWGDGVMDNSITGNIIHTYEKPGTYQVSISGTFPRIYFANPFNNKSSDGDKLESIDQWGDIAWTSMSNAFSGCDNLDITAVDVPDLYNVSGLNFMFARCPSLVGNISMGKWDVRNVTNTVLMFLDTPLFNQDIGNWDVGNIDNMNGMFSGASSFNQDLGNWNVSNVEHFGSMFAGATNFNQNIGSWNVSKGQMILHY